MAIKAVLFDIEDVFFDGTYWHRHLHQVISKLGVAIPFAQFQHVWQKKYLPKVYSGQSSYWDAMASFFCSWGISETLVRELIAGAQPKLKSVQASLRLFPEVNPALASLRKARLKLGIVCNSIHQPDELLANLRKGRLAGELDLVLTSQVQGRELPCSPSLSQIAQDWSLAPEELAYVSAKCERLNVAYATGLFTIRMITPRSQPAPAGFSAHRTFSSLSELPRWLTNPSRREPQFSHAS
jgi:FMN phosphatase YigB (HAD superfamily)